MLFGIVFVVCSLVVFVGLSSCSGCCCHCSLVLFKFGVRCLLFDVRCPRFGVRCSRFSVVFDRVRVLVICSLLLLLFLLLLHVSVLVR